MRLLITTAAVGAALLLSSCATPVRQTDSAMTRYDKNTDYVIEPRPNGFGISIDYRRYQFLPESDAVAVACKQALTSIAHEHASKAGRSIEQINEQAIRLSMGRNEFSGITSCLASAPAVWKD